MNNEINKILFDAVSKNASDIHFNPDRLGVDVKYRMGGVLKKVSRIESIEQYGKYVKTVKSMFHGDLSIDNLPQDGRIIMKIDDRRVDFRVAIFPSLFGEKITFRTLDNLRIKLDFKDIFVLEEDIDKIHEVLKATHGMVLVNGPTGSGKTTTLYSMINHFVKKNESMIISVEDPVEYVLEGVVQSQIDDKVGKTFPAMLRASLRSDPDIVMAGEIRDKETMELLIKTALTGHYVLSALHTSDAVSSIRRFMDISGSMEMIGSALIALINQRLLRKPCPHCKTEYLPSDSELLSLGIKREENMKFVKSVGCDKCYNTGYRGRIAIYEIVKLDKKLKDLIIKGNMTRIQDYIESNYLIFSKKIGMYVKSGYTTYEEALRIMSDFLQ